MRVFILRNVKHTKIFKTVVSLFPPLSCQLPILDSKVVLIFLKHDVNFGAFSGTI